VRFAGFCNASCDDPTQLTDKSGRSIGEKLTKFRRPKEVADTSLERLLSLPRGFRLALSPNRGGGVAEPPFTQTGTPAAISTHRTRPLRAAAPGVSESLNGMAEFRRDNRQQAAMTCYTA
jgi:hypothetical protein